MRWKRGLTPDRRIEQMILGRLQNRRGTSLIEILTTLVILVIGILSVARMFSGGFVVMKRSENITLASRLAEGEFERLRRGR